MKLRGFLVRSRLFNCGQLFSERHDRVLSMADMQGPTNAK
jgi:hypothetical protein